MIKLTRAISERFLSKKGEKSKKYFVYFGIYITAEKIRNAPQSHLISGYSDFFARNAVDYVSEHSTVGLGNIFISMN